jgi:ornithine carbamoyltransferase
MNNLLSIEDLNGPIIEALLADALRLKAARGHHETPLTGQTWAMLFTKSSTRTRVSFEVGIHELGGNPMFLSKNDIQLGRGEPIQDTARVLGRMVHGAVIRTFDQADVVDFARLSGIPTVNALTDEEHPCQILADLMTVKELSGGWQGKKIAFIGDGFSNMTVSWMWAAKHLGFALHVACPPAYSPSRGFLDKLDAASAARDAAVINTDVWLSMGQEDQKEKEQAFGPFQVNAALLKHAAAGHIVLHCLPAYREKEITAEVLENHAAAIFQQAENRLHVQKAILVAIANNA